MPQSPITKIQEDRFGQRKKLSQFFFFLVALNWGKRRKERGYVRTIYSKLIELATTAKFCYDFHMGVITSFLCTTVLVCSGIYLYCITAAKTYTQQVSYSRKLALLPGITKFNLSYKTQFPNAEKNTKLYIRSTFGIARMLSL